MTAVCFHKVAMFKPLNENDILSKFCCANTLRRPETSAVIKPEDGSRLATPLS